MKGSELTTCPAPMISNTTLYVDFSVVSNAELMVNVVVRSSNVPLSDVALSTVTCALGACGEAVRAGTFL